MLLRIRGMIRMVKNITEIENSLAVFPSTARRDILSAISDDGGGNEAAVIAGFYYRDLDGNGRYDPGEECEATLLGEPAILESDVVPALYHNCYLFGPLKSGETYTIRFAPDGVQPFETTVETSAGLNICQIPIVPAKQLVYVVPHSHFDTEWVYTYEECLQRVEIPNLNQRIDLLEKYPSYCFCMDEECVTLPYLERSKPHRREVLRQGIIEGSIEPKGIITQQELVMPYGESLIRNITMGDTLLSDLVGEAMRPAVYWSVDQYGIGYQIPQILAKAGRPYFLMGEYVGLGYGPACEFGRIPFSNPDTFDHPDFWLEGMDGSRVLVHRSQYARPDVLPPPFKTVESLDSEMIFQGWDNYAPDPELIDKVKKLNAENGEYKYIITPSPSFFKVAERNPDMPVLSTESFITYWSGVYESRIVGRLQNRKLENTIMSTETVATFANIEGMSFPSSLFEAWYLLLLNQHHDPLMTPMATPSLFDNAIPARYDAARALIDGASTSAISWLGVDIATDEAEGQPVIVFNSCGTGRNAVVESEIAGEFDGIEVRDNRGKIHPGQILQSAPKNGNAGSTIVAFLAGGLPSVGWKTFYVNGIEPTGTTAGAAGTPDPAGAVNVSDNCLENDFIRIELADGRITRVTEKTTSTEVMKADDKAGVNEVVIWKDEGCISVVRPVDPDDIVQFIGNPNATIVDRSSTAASVKVEVLESGPVRGTVRISYELDQGVFAQYISLDAGSRVIRFSADVLWNTGAGIDPYNGRRVRIAFNTTYKNAGVHCDIPFGVIEWRQSEMIRPVTSWLGVDSEGTGMAFCHGGPPSIQVVDDVVYMTLFRSVTEPNYDKDDPNRCHWDNPEDQAADEGHHIIDYSVYVHPGDWQTAKAANAVQQINSDVLVRTTNRHSGVDGPLRPGERSYLGLDPTDLVLVAFKPAEYTDGDFVARFFNPTGKPVSGTLRIDFEHERAEITNFREETESQLQGKSPYTLQAGPHEIVTVKIYR